MVWARAARSGATQSDQGRLSEDAEKALDDGRKFGMDAASIANLRAALTADAMAAGDAEFDGIWPDNLPTAQAFFAVNGQWRIVTRSAGGYASPWGGMLAPTVPMFVGLDYAAVKVGLEAEGIAVTPELWRGLRAMEQAACKVLNEDS